MLHTVIKRTGVSMGLGVALLLSAVPVHADEAMTAEVLFNDGVALMKNGKYAEGCPKIAESQRVEPRPGTLFTLAECLSKQGKLATALARYEEYLRVFSRMTEAEQGKQRGRDVIARSQRDELAPRIPQLMLKLPKTAPAGTKVVKDGVELGSAALGTWLPVDPGEQTIEVQRPDGGVAETRVSLDEREKKQVTLELPPASKGAGQPEREQETPATSSKPGKNQTLGWVALGIGGAGLITSAVTGILVLGKKSTIDENCGINGDETACNAKGKSAADSAKALSLVSTVGFVVGVVGVGGGTYLLVSGSSSSNSARVAVSGHF